MEPIESSDEHIQNAYIECSKLYDELGVVDWRQQPIEKRLRVIRNEYRAALRQTIRTRGPSPIAEAEVV
jgi:hypothetical protein